MANNKKRDFRCNIVNETVKIHLCKKAEGGWRSKSVFFVQCNQSDCQYVEKNEPPSL